MVVVHPPTGAKCPRCWRFVKGVEEEICGRCEHVVKSEG
jgi:isoleucyl-tRNA synthetase